MSYLSRLKSEQLDYIQTGIYQKIVLEKKFQDKTYSQTKLAEDLNVDKRYISAAFKLMLNTNYNTFVNKHRVAMAISLFTDRNYNQYNVEDIGHAVGFANRQSFYNAFRHIMGVTPKQYRLNLK